jgi:hypothetical protein
MIRAIPIIVNQTIAGAFVALICLFSIGGNRQMLLRPRRPPITYHACDLLR